MKSIHPICFTSGCSNFQPFSRTRECSPRNGILVKHCIFSCNRRRMITVITVNTRMRESRFQGHEATRTEKSAAGSHAKWVTVLQRSQTMTNKRTECRPHEDGRSTKLGGGVRPTTNWIDAILKWFYLRMWMDLRRVTPNAKASWKVAVNVWQMFFSSLPENTSF